MRAFGWLLILGGGAWAVFGAVNVWTAFEQAIYAETEAARNAASQATAVSLFFNGLVFIFPGLVVAGIGALVSRAGHRRSTASTTYIEPKGVDSAEARVPCPTLRGDDLACGEDLPLL